MGVSTHTFRIRYLYCAKLKECREHKVGEVQRVGISSVCRVLRERGLGSGQGISPVWGEVLRGLLEPMWDLLSFLYLNIITPKVQELLYLIATTTFNAQGHLPPISQLLVQFLLQIRIEWQYCNYVATTVRK